MWAELFLENKDNLLNEINIFIDNMNEYKTALENDDREMLVRILDEGRRRKEEVDG
jgi:prephenate dehydrogenase